MAVYKLISTHSVHIFQRWRKNLDRDISPSNLACFAALKFALQLTIPYINHQIILMRAIYALFCFISDAASSAYSAPHPKGDAFCQAKTGDAGSYCKYSQDPPHCKGADIDCSSSSIEAYFLASAKGSDLGSGPFAGPTGQGNVALGGPAAWESVTLAQRDTYCRKETGNSGSYCKARSDKDYHVCHGSELDCSQQTVYKAMYGARIPTTTSAPSGNPKTTTSRTYSTRLTDKRSTFTTTRTTTTIPTTKPPTTSGTPGTDPCTLPGALMLGRSPTSGDSYFMPVSTLRECLLSTRISHANALWTLHNLYYGVAETYSFTDIAVNSLQSRHTNMCGYKLHAVSVDLKGELAAQISKYNDVLSPLTSSDQTDAYLAQERPAYEFHANLLRLMNNLHDAHTLYSTPYDMFRVYAPFNFGSRMDGGKQVITLRYTSSSADPVGRLAYVHQRLFGSAPFPDTFNGKIISQINGVDALSFLLQMVADNAPLSASYQQAEQRLNAFFFSTPLLVFGLTLSTMPKFDAFDIKFADGTVRKVNLLGQFADLSTSPYYTVPNLRSTSALSSYLHSNPAFNAFMNHEENAKVMQSTLWKSASAAAKAPDAHAAHLMSKAGSERWLQLSASHKALLCPIKNYLRDHILNVPPLPDMLFDDAGRSPFAEASVLARVIKDQLASNRATSAVVSFTDLGAMSFAIVNKVMVVRVPSMVPEPRSEDDQLFYYFPDFVKVQQAAKQAGVTRLLFDLTNNGGGYVMSAYALLWYTMAEPLNACAPLRKRMTPNWQLWINSFGDGLEAIVDKYLGAQGESLADKIDQIFAEITSLVSLLYEGLGLTFDQLGSVTKSVALARVTATKASILAKTSKSDRAKALVKYIKTRGFIPADAAIIDQMMPLEGFTPFDPNELCKVKSNLEFFTDPNSIYTTNAEKKDWGRESLYSQPGLYSFCFQTLQQMPRVATGYQTGYWTQTAFVSDGTCGSACALFTQALQTNGDAVAFTYGGVADSPLDVASFAGGNVEEYSSFWPSLAFAAKVGRLASDGKAPWSKTHENTWVSSPIAFPTRATARFNWNMMFSSAMGPDALPRQFYLIPARKHLNVWTASEDGLAEVYSQITGIQDWGAIPAQFAPTHGQCPKERTPFAIKPRNKLY